jgi:hypothetical protein
VRGSGSPSAGKEALTPRPSGGWRKSHARSAGWARTGDGHRIAQHHGGPSPFVVVFCPDGEWQPGATFGLDDVRRGLEALEVDGVREAAWPCGMIFSRDGRLFRVDRRGRKGLRLVRHGGV